MGLRGAASRGRQASRPPHQDFIKVRIRPELNGFRADEAAVLTRRWDWNWQRTQVLVLTKDTPLRVMRLKPQLELWPPELPPIGRRWRKLESLVPDPDVIL